MNGDGTTRSRRVGRADRRRHRERNLRAGSGIPRVDLSGSILGNGEENMAALGRIHQLEPWPIAGRLTCPQHEDVEISLLGCVRCGTAVVLHGGSPGCPSVPRELLEQIPLPATCPPLPAHEEVTDAWVQLASYSIGEAGKPRWYKLTGGRLPWDPAVVAGKLLEDALGPATAPTE